MSSTTTAMASTHQPSRFSRWTARFLRVSLLPAILIGVPLWPILAISCAVPFLALVTIPLFILLSLFLVYSLSWFTYLVLAQADAPVSERSRLANVLPFLPYSPLKCLKVTWASLLYSSAAIRLLLPAVLDWSYRRVMVLGTTAGAAVVTEGILYGPAENGKRLDVYIPPARSGRDSTSSAESAGDPANQGKRTRKHSTIFNEPPPAVSPGKTPVASPADAPRRPNARDSTAPEQPQRGAAVIVFLPSSVPPVTWTSKRRAYLQLALRLRRMGYCVVVPDIAYFPESRIAESIVDVRWALNWVGENIATYGGDPDRIHLMGHGLSAHLALLTVTQEAVVLSREGILEAQAHRDQQKASIEERWQKEEEDRRLYAGASSSANTPDSPPHGTKVAGSAPGPVRRARVTSQAHTSGDAWVDEPTSVEEEAEAHGGLAPGIVLPTRTSASATERIAKQLDDLQGDDGEDLDEEGNHRRRGGSTAAAAAGSAAGSATRVATPTSRSFPAASPSPSPASVSRKAQQLTQRRRQRLQQRRNGSDSEEDHLLDIPIPNGLRRVEIYRPDIDVPPIAGLILFSGVSDVIKGFRNETERGVEDLSVLRRSCGPGHTSCLLHSPAHLLYAAKNLIDASLLPPKVLLVHGGQDAVVPIEQSTLLKTLLVGIGVSHVRLRAYRKLGHVESIACLFLGMNKGMKRYLKMIGQDLDDFLAA